MSSSAQKIWNIIWLTISSYQNKFIFNYDLIPLKDPGNNVWNESLELHYFFNKSLKVNLKVHYDLRLSNQYFEANY